MKRTLPQWTSRQVRLLRLHCGLSQQELADRLAIRQATISHWENERIQPRRSSRKLLTEFAQYAHFPMEYIHGF